MRNVLEWGGGGLLDIGCYPINASRLLLGGEPRPVGMTIVRDPLSGVDTMASAVLEFPGGAVATFTVSMRAPNSQGFQIFGTEAKVFVERPFNPSAHDLSRVLVEPRDGSEPEWLTFGPANQYVLMAEAFAFSVLENVVPEFAPDDAIPNLEVIDGLFAMAAPETNSI